jgi:hypothetical protein
MALFAYFSDQPDGSVIEFRDRVERFQQGMYSRSRVIPARVWHDGKRYLGTSPDGERVVISRRVELKSNPSRHECNGACINASGRVMRCECACGGKNHGRGAFNCEAA